MFEVKCRPVYHSLSIKSETSWGLSNSLVDKGKVKFLISICNLLHSLCFPGFSLTTTVFWLPSRDPFLYLITFLFSKTSDYSTHIVATASGHSCGTPSPRIQNPLWLVDIASWSCCITNLLQGARSFFQNLIVASLPGTRMFITILTTGLSYALSWVSLILSTIRLLLFSHLPKGLRSSGFPANTFHVFFISVFICLCIYIVSLVLSSLQNVHPASFFSSLLSQNTLLCTLFSRHTQFHVLFLERRIKFSYPYK
jgi:hypothetical protein